MRARHRASTTRAFAAGPTARRTGRALVAASLIVSCSLSGTASADVVSDAKSKAASLRQRVEKLRLRAEVNAEAYDRAVGASDDATSAYLSGEQALQAAQQRADTAREAAAGRIVAIYETGGPLAVYTGAVTDGTLTDAYDSVQMARTVVSGGEDVLAQSAAALDAVTDLDGRLAALRDKQTASEALAAQAADAARGSANDAETLLASADDNVRRLVAEQEAAAQAAAAEEFARQVAAAQAAAEARAAAAAAATNAGPSLAGLPTDTTTSPAAAIAIAAARSKIGLPYLWGGTGPDAYDCSGLTQFAYAQAGIHLPRVAADQYNYGRHVAINELLPGDLVYWATDVNNPATIHHMAMYIGNGRMIAAPHTGAFVREQDMYATGYIGATRPVG